MAAPAAALAHRSAVGDRVILDWLDLDRITADRGRPVFTVRELEATWNRDQSTVSRRLSAINQAPRAVGLGRVVRIPGSRSWEVIRPQSAPTEAA